MACLAHDQLVTEFKLRLVSSCLSPEICAKITQIYKSRVETVPFYCCLKLFSSYFPTADGKVEESAPALFSPLGRMEEGKTSTGMGDLERARKRRGTQEESSLLDLRICQLFHNSLHLLRINVFFSVLTFSIKEPNKILNVFF